MEAIENSPLCLVSASLQQLLSLCYVLSIYLRASLLLPEVFHYNLVPPNGCEAPVPLGCSGEVLWISSQLWNQQISHFGGVHSYFRGRAPFTSGSSQNWKRLPISAPMKHAAHPPAHSPIHLLYKKPILAEATTRITIASESDRGNIQHEDKSMKSIWLSSLKMPKCQRVQKKQHFSVPYQTPLILCDISWQFPALCKCLPAIWFKQMSWVKQPDRQFLGGCFLFSLSCLTERPSNGQISPGDRGVIPPPLLLSLLFSHFVFFFKAKRSWMLLVFMLDIEPSARKYYILPAWCCTKL